MFNLLQRTLQIILQARFARIQPAGFMRLNTSRLEKCIA